MISLAKQLIRIFGMMSCGLSLAAGSFAQSKPEEPPQAIMSIKVRTGLVLIPAGVTDSKGQRVTDMKKEDFAVLEDGKRQEIQVFEHITTTAGGGKHEDLPDGVITNTLGSGPSRITIFVMDMLNSSILEQQQARKELLDFLSKTLDTREPLCLIGVDSNGAWLIHDFTMDPAVLIDALKQTKKRLTDIDRPGANPEDEAFRNVQGWNSKSGTRNAAMIGAQASVMRMSAGLAEVSRGERVRLTLLAMQEIGASFVGIPGRKSMIWATAGFPFEMGDASAFGRSGVFQGAGEAGMLKVYEDTWRELNEANIAVYPLDVSNLVNPAWVSAGVGRPRPQHVSAAFHVAYLENLADVTGGKFCDRNMDAKKCFEQAADDLSDYYLLGIYDKSGKEKPGWRKLSVRTTREGLRIKARSGYYLGSGATERPSEAQEMQMALVSPFDNTGLPMSVRLLAATAGSNPDTKKIRFVYAIPPAAVRVEAESGNALRLEFAALARDPSGKMLGSFSKVIEGKMSEAQAVQVKEKGVLFTGTMELAPGEYTLSFAVKDKVNDNLGSVMAPLLKVE